MLDLTPLNISLMLAASTAAGLVDAIVGGGGLIQLPALFIFLPRELAASIPLVFGTNKLSSLCGTSVAAWQYSRRVRIPWASIRPATIAAFFFSALGVRVLQSVRSEFLRPLTLVLLIAVAIYTYSRKSLGHLHAPKFLADHERWMAVAVGVVIGFYDGFFGPGVGSFWLIAFVTVLGYDLVRASAHARVMNFASNLAALLFFAAVGKVAWLPGLVMGAGQFIGGRIGSHLALNRGARFIRPIFLLMASLVALKLIYASLSRGP